MFDPDEFRLRGSRWDASIFLKFMSNFRPFPRGCSACLLLPSLLIASSAQAQISDPATLPAVVVTASVIAATAMPSVARKRGVGNRFRKVIIVVYTPHSAVDGKTHANPLDFIA